MLGQRIRALRKLHGMSLRALAAASGVTYGHIAKIERGEHPNPGIDTLKRLAAGLKIDLETLTEST